MRDYQGSQYYVELIALNITRDQIIITYVGCPLILLSKHS